MCGCLDPFVCHCAFKYSLLNILSCPLKMVLEGGDEKGPIKLYANIVLEPKVLFYNP